MERMNIKDQILAHKTRWTIVIYVFLVFIGCFVFPIFNLTKKFDTWWSNVLIACVSYYEIGILQGTLYGNKGIRKIIVISFGMTLLGFICRFFLEYGEVSNSYNFTLSNIVLHLFVAISITTLTAFFVGRNR